MKVYEIWPGALYQRGRTNSLPTEELHAFAHEKNIGLVIQVSNRPDHRWSFITRFIHQYFPDGRHPAAYAEAVGYAVREAARIIRNGGAVLVFCNAGRNRASFVSSLILREIGYRDCTVERLRALRPGAFGSNEVLAQYLEGWEHTR